MSIKSDILLLTLDFTKKYGVFYGQNIERGYMDILFNNVIVMRYNSSFEIK